MIHAAMSAAATSSKRPAQASGLENSHPKPAVLRREVEKLLRSMREERHQHLAPGTLSIDGDRVEAIVACWLSRPVGQWRNTDKIRC
jgi:hypothetical protein